MLWRGTIPGIVAFETLPEEEPFRIFHQKKILRGYRLYQQHQLTTTTALCLSKELLWSRPLVRAKKWIVSTNLNFILDLLDADAHKNTLSIKSSVQFCENRKVRGCYWSRWCESEASEREGGRQECVCVGLPNGCGCVCWVHSHPHVKLHEQYCCSCRSRMKTQVNKNCATPPCTPTVTRLVKSSVSDDG